MRIVLAGLKLDALHVVHPGEHRYRLEQRVEVVRLAEMVAAR